MTKDTCAKCGKGLPDKGTCKSCDKIDKIRAQTKADNERDTKKVPKSKPNVIDADLLHDIELTTANDEQFYRQHHIPWVKNFMRKRKRDVFNEELALKGIRLYYVKDAVNRYNEITGDNHKLNKDEKEALAKIYLENVLDDVKSFEESKTKVTDIN